VVKLRFTLRSPLPLKSSSLIKNTNMKPKLLLRLEGAAALALACVCYQQSHGGWLWFALLLLSPDLFMLGYLAGTKSGAFFYNLAHTYLLPLGLLAVYEFTGHIWLLWLALIWLAHIGADRLLGYGLKYETAFKDTHLQRV
jgi:hypothetical protein